MLDVRVVTWCVRNVGDGDDRVSISLGIASCSLSFPLSVKQAFAEADAGTDMEGEKTALMLPI